MNKCFLIFSVIVAAVLPAGSCALFDPSVSVHVISEGEGMVLSFASGERFFRKMR